MSSVRCQVDIFLKRIQNNKTMTKIKGIHILSTVPSRLHGKNKYSPDCLEVASIVLSALLWREHNGSLRLYTDTSAFDFFGKNKLLSLWDDGIDLNVVESIPDNIHQGIFWAAAKIFALRDAKAPVAMIDNDLFIWKKLPDFVFEPGITVLHPEDLWNCYVTKDRLSIPPGYSFNALWNWNIRPLNTAFAFFQDDVFKNRYVNESIKFMMNNTGRDAHPSSQMVFAEQRILAMCANAEGIPIHYLASNPFDEGNALFTHIWGAKDIARQNCQKMDSIMSAILTVIKKLSKDYYQLIKNNLIKDY